MDTYDEDLKALEAKVRLANAATCAECHRAEAVSHSPECKTRRLEDAAREELERSEPSMTLGLIAEIRRLRKEADDEEERFREEFWGIYNAIQDYIQELAKTGDDTPELWSCLRLVKHWNG